MLLIREEDVKEILTMKMCIDAVEESYREYGLRTAVNSPRHNLWISPPKSLKSASATFGGFTGLTAYTGGYGSKGSGPSTTLLYNSSSGELLALVESRLLGWYRTGATVLNETFSML